MRLSVRRLIPWRYATRTFRLLQFYPPILFSVVVEAFSAEILQLNLFLWLLHYRSKSYRVFRIRNGLLSAPAFICFLFSPYGNILMFDYHLSTTFFYQFFRKRKDCSTSPLHKRFPYLTMMIWIIRRKNIKACEFLSISRILLFSIIWEDNEHYRLLIKWEKISRAATRAHQYPLKARCSPTF